MIVKWNTYPYTQMCALCNVGISVATAVDYLNVTYIYLYKYILCVVVYVCAAFVCRVPTYNVMQLIQ
jgi:hypothetical protein